LAFLLCYSLFSDKPAAGEKQLVVEVIHKDGSSREFSYSTDMEYLGELLLSEGLVRGEQGPYGLYILWVDGEQVNEAEQEWWCLTKAGETVTTGADTTPIASGDCFELTLTVGY